MPPIPTLSSSLLHQTQRTLDGLRSHRLLERAILRPADDPVGQTKVTRLSNAQSSGNAVGSNVDRGRKLLAEASAGLGAVDTHLATLEALAKQAEEAGSDLRGNLQASFTAGLADILALTQEPNSSGDYILYGSSEDTPLQLGEGVELSLEAVDPTALGIAGASLLTSAGAVAAGTLLGEARSLVQTQIRQVEVLDQRLEAKDARLNLQGGQQAAVLAALQAVDEAALLRQEQVIQERTENSLKEASEIRQQAFAGLKNLLAPPVPPKKTEAAKKEEEAKKKDEKSEVSPLNAKKEEESPLSPPLVPPLAAPLNPDLEARFRQSPSPNVGSVVSVQS